jgi:hypothetical protein
MKQPSITDQGLKVPRSFHASALHQLVMLKDLYQPPRIRMGSAPAAEITDEDDLPPMEYVTQETWGNYLRYLQRC